MGGEIAVVLSLSGLVFDNLSPKGSTCQRLSLPVTTGVGRGGTAGSVWCCSRGVVWAKAAEARGRYSADQADLWREEITPFRPYAMDSITHRRPSLMGGVVCECLPL